MEFTTLSSGEFAGWFDSEFKDEFLEKQRSGFCVSYEDQQDLNRYLGLPEGSVFLRDSDGGASLENRKFFFHEEFCFLEDKDGKFRTRTVFPVTERDGNTEQTRYSVRIEGDTNLLGILNDWSLGVVAMPRVGAVKLPVAKKQTPIGDTLSPKLFETSTVTVSPGMTGGFAFEGYTDSKVYEKWEGWKCF
jgi:hypothetical protein